MGSDASKNLTPTQLDDLKEQTAFSRSEIRDMFKKFHAECPAGQMTKVEFQNMYESLFPRGDSHTFADHVFKAYDKDGNGVIDFKEFLVTVSVASRGSIDEKLRWAFNMYDLDGNGYVTKQEVLEMFRAIFRMRGGNLGMTSSEGRTLNPEEAVDELFDHLDKNCDEKLSAMEFILGAKHSPCVLGILQSDHRGEF